MCQFTDHISTCRCDHHYICFLCNRYMLYLKLKIPVKGIHQTFISCESFKSDRIDKIRGILCHQHMNICMAFLQRACQICNLIRAMLPVTPSNTVFLPVSFSFTSFSEPYYFWLFLRLYTYMSKSIIIHL